VEICTARPAVPLSSSSKNAAFLLRAALSVENRTVHPFLPAQATQSFTFRWSAELISFLSPNQAM
jgi:hypothetical protein